MLDERCWVDVAPGWLDGGDELLGQLADDLPWKQSRRLMWGNWVDEPRLTCGCASAEGDTPPSLRDMAAALSARYGVDFDSCFCNYYREGTDSVAWHSDRDGRVQLDPLRRHRVARRPAPVRDASEGRRRASRHAGALVDAALRRPARDGWVVPAHVGARGAQDAQRAAAHERHVPAPSRSETGSSSDWMNTPFGPGGDQAVVAQFADGEHLAALDAVDPRRHLEWPAERRRPLVAHGQRAGERAEAVHHVERAEQLVEDQGDDPPCTIDGGPM